MVGVLASEVVVEDMVEVPDTVTKAERGFGGHNNYNDGGHFGGTF